MISSIYDDNSIVCFFAIQIVEDSALSNTDSFFLLQMLHNLWITLQLPVQPSEMINIEHLHLLSIIGFSCYFVTTNVLFIIEIATLLELSKPVAGRGRGDLQLLWNLLKRQTRLSQLDNILSNLSWNSGSQYFLSSWWLWCYCWGGLSNILNSFGRTSVVVVELLLLLLLMWFSSSLFVFLNGCVGWKMLSEISAFNGLLWLLFNIAAIDFNNNKR